MPHRRTALGPLLMIVLLAASCGDDTASTTVPGDATTPSIAATTTTTIDHATTIAVAGDSVVLAHRGIGIGPNEYYFGDDADTVVAAVAAVLGPPTDDSGWMEDPVEGGQTRSTNWDGLWLQFRGGAADGVFSFYYFGGTPLPQGVELVLPGIEPGSTFTAALAVIGMYREDVALDQWQWVQGAIMGNWVLQTGNPEFGHMCLESGLGSEPSGDDTVRSVFSGRECTWDGE